MSDLVSRTCGYHYEVYGKCNDIASVHSIDWPSTCALPMGHEGDHNYRYPTGKEPPVQQGPVGSVQVGDWVEIVAQVKALHLGGDVLEVDLFSKTDQYRAAVLADRCTKIDPPHGIADRCHHLWSDTQGEMLYRCRRHLDHEGQHESMSIIGPSRDAARWDTAHTFGYVEAR